MTRAHQLNAIRRWFDQHHGGGLVLPDGWFGRPYDNHHRLTDLQECDDDIVIVLDDNVTITIKDVKRATSSDLELDIGSSERIRVEWTTYDDPPQRRSTEYSAGSVKIVKFPG